LNESLQHQNVECKSQLVVSGCYEKSKHEAIESSWTQ
jgi:hypothetical protein